MLPAAKTHRLSLADVLPSCLDAVRGQENRLALRGVAKAVVILVDGLGAQALAARSGHARTLAPLLNRGSTIGAGFPTTTAAALATFTTGRAPGEHGLVGYTVLDAANDRVVNQLSGWDDRLDPATWQRSRTIFEQAADVGVPSYVVSTENHRSSGLTAAILRGAHYRSAPSIAGRLEAARAILDQTPSAIVYVYIAELDKVGHSDGCESAKWTDQLEEIDGAIRDFSASLRPDEGLLVTADHGVLDIAHRSHVLFDEIDGLVDGIRFIAGEPRCLQLHIEPDASRAVRDSLLAAWLGSEGERSWVATRAEAIAAGWFGDTVAAEVEPRIGDIIVAARRNIAYYDSRAPSQRGRNMVGQHGSLSPAETAIPLLRFGAFAG
ncbi:MAG: alkaline phosphatase family protein [Burkholderiaceae bacterium]|nr:alkaline phosphatase family protein [Microbacteriaceae bacterium]